MHPEPHSATVTLARGRLLRIGGGARLACLSGSLWITEEGSSRDLVLPAGERTTLTRPGLTLAQALGGDAVLELRWVAAPHRQAAVFRLT